jgi:glycosyltransferase involved in cell wall biosynthesis
MSSALQHDEPFELSVVIPCLNEADTLGICLEVAQRALDDHGIKGEIVVADNGSTDGSQEIAKRSGARVVGVPERGYGSALMGGIAVARGRYVVMGDADGSYDFGEIPKFLAKLREGFDLVQGCRLPSGGGRILDGAMPPLHRWIGNPRGLRGIGSARRFTTSTAVFAAFRLTTIAGSSSVVSEWSSPRR